MFLRVTLFIFIMKIPTFSLYLSDVSGAIHGGLPSQGLGQSISDANLMFEVGVTLLLAWSQISLGCPTDNDHQSQQENTNRSETKLHFNGHVVKLFVFPQLTHVLNFFLIHILLSTHISLIIRFFPLHTVLVGWSRDRQRQQHHLAGHGDGIYEAGTSFPGSHQRQHPQDVLFYGADGEGPRGQERASPSLPTPL